MEIKSLERNSISPERYLEALMRLRDASDQRTLNPTRDQKKRIDGNFGSLLRKRGLSSVTRFMPEELEYRWRSLFGEEYERTVIELFTELPKTIRVNRLKTEPEELARMLSRYNWQLIPMPFSEVTFRLLSPNRINFSKTTEYNQGLFYVQELASMLPVFALDPNPGEKVLDIAAAPGSKTTQAAELMRNTGVIVANDLSADRLDILRSTARKLGITNLEYNSGEGQSMGDIYPGYFDKVMVDAPCSSEGIIRNRPHKLLVWNIGLITELPRIQSELIESGYKALRPNGILIYSTCTFSPEENEGVVSSFLKNHPSAELLQIKFEGISLRPGIKEWQGVDFDSQISSAIRIYPQDNNSIGFFMAKIRKSSS